MATITKAMSDCTDPVPEERLLNEAKNQWEDLGSFEWETIDAPLIFFGSCQPASEVSSTKGGQIETYLTDDFAMDHMTSTMGNAMTSGGSQEASTSLTALIPSAAPRQHSDDDLRTRHARRLKATSERIQRKLCSCSSACFCLVQTGNQ